MAVLSKGKSGGVRVLTYTVQNVNPEKIVITLLSIFDKSDIENVSDGYIKSLVKEVKINMRIDSSYLYFRYLC